MPTLTASTAAREALAKRFAPPTISAALPPKPAPSSPQKAKAEKRVAKPTTPVVKPSQKPEKQPPQLPVAPEPSAAPESAGPNYRMRKSAERIAQQKAARDKLWPILSSVFPEIFRLPPVPLAIGIHNQILEVAGEDIDPKELGAFLAYWCRRWGYLRAVWQGQVRRNLDGSEAGMPTPEQQHIAAGMLLGAERAKRFAPAAASEQEAVAA